MRQLLQDILLQEGSTSITLQVEGFAESPAVVKAHLQCMVLTLQREGMKMQCMQCR